MKGWVQAAMLAITVYVGFCAFLFLMQQRLIFHPRPVGHVPVGPQFAPATVQSGDVTLRGWIVKEASQGPVLIYFGGNAEDISGRLRDFAALDATISALDELGANILLNIYDAPEWSRERYLTAVTRLVDRDVALADMEPRWE